MEYFAIFRWTIYEAETVLISYMQYFSWYFHVFSGIYMGIYLVFAFTKSQYTNLKAMIIQGSL